MIKEEATSTDPTVVDTYSVIQDEAKSKCGAIKLPNGRELNVYIIKKNNQRLQLNLYEEKNTDIQGEIIIHKINHIFSFTIQLFDAGLKRQGLGKSLFEMTKTISPDIFKSVNQAQGIWMTQSPNADNYIAFAANFKSKTELDIPSMPNETDFYSLDPHIQKALLDSASDTFTGKMYSRTFGFYPKSVTTTNQEKISWVTVAFSQPQHNASTPPAL